MIRLNEFWGKVDGIELCHSRRSGVSFTFSFSKKTISIDQMNSRKVRDVVHLLTEIFFYSFLFTRNSKNSEEVEWDVESDADSAEHAEPEELQKQTEPEPEVLPENATSLTESLARAPEEKDRTKAALELSEKLYQVKEAKFPKL